MRLMQACYFSVIFYSQIQIAAVCISKGNNCVNNVTIWKFSLIAFKLVC